MNISHNKKLRGSSSLQATDAESNNTVPSVVPGRKNQTIIMPENYSLLDIRTGGLWSISDYTQAKYTSVYTE
ncbi:MAG: hypothetical protein WCW35_02020 [Bacteroidota bacterium]